MTERGQQIYDKMMSEMGEVATLDPCFIQKRWLFNHIAMLCRLYDVGKNTALAMSLREMGFVFPFICDKRTKYVTLTISYDNVNYMLVNFGVTEFTVRTTYSNLIRVIETIENITENQFYQDDRTWLSVVGNVFTYLKSEGVITV